MISVVATVLNEGESIRRLLESLVMQVRFPDEVVIVDGGSKDQTRAILREYESRLPLRESVLLMTSRASYDILQKAALASIPIVAVIGAPSTAAIALAERHQITLIGFLRDDRFNVYTASWRVAGT